jgi:hypothetical protein
MLVDRRNTLLQPGDEVSLPTLKRKHANGLNFATNRVHDYLPNAGSIAARPRAAEQASARRDGDGSTYHGSMTDKDDKILESAGSSLQGPPDEALRQTVLHDNGDLTIQSEAGKIRLISGSDGWKRYKGYLEARNIELDVEET